LDEEKSKHVGLAHQNGFGCSICDPANSNWMKKSQNMSVWLTKTILDAPYVSLQIKIG
jgi:hypothetical protein